MNEEGVQVFKEKGRIADLRNIVDDGLWQTQGLVIHVGQHMAYQAKIMRIRIKVHLDVLHSFIMV